MAGLLVMLNNFLHDLAVAVFFCAWMGLLVLAREAQEQSAVRRLNRAFRKTAGWSFFFILAFGIVRTVYYREYEWYSAVEHGQVAALAVKHALFVVIIVAGWAYLWKTRKNRAG
jgi:hypothetical protein